MVTGFRMRFNVYVDGFNLYYGALRGQPYRWLDIRQFAQKLLRPGDEVGTVRYFTARVSSLPQDPSAPDRQDAYFRALRTLSNVSIHFGAFLVTRPVMPRADGRGSIRVIKTEEKGSDVNLATHLLLDASDGGYDGALVISNDSDLVEPVRQVQARFKCPVGVALPILNRNRDGSRRPSSTELLKAATFNRRISDTRKRRKQLAECQFPETLSDARGSFTRPRGWA